MVGIFIALVLAGPAAGG